VSEPNVSEPNVSESKVSNRTPQFSIAFQTDKRPGAYAELAARAEKHGFDGVSVFADLLYQPPLPALLEMAAATSRIRLGAACFNPYTMHPYEIAGQIAAVDAWSGGRAYLGLARGTWLGAIGVAQPRPLARMRSAVRVIQALLAGEKGAVEDDIFPLAAGTVLRYPLPPAGIPLLIGTWGARTAAFAGECADEVKVGGSTNPAMAAVMRERIAAGAVPAGRDATDVGLVFGAVTVVDEDGPAARALARREVAMYLAVVAELDTSVPVPPDLIARVQQEVAAGNDAAAGLLMPDDVLDRFACSGTPEQVAAQAQALVDAGVRRVEFGTPHGLDPATGVDLLGRRVLRLLG